MGTEVRIGVLTGLLIVVVAGVYFFYGRNRDSQDLEIVTGKTPVAVPTIPSGRDVKPGATAARTTPTANATPHSTAANNSSRPVTTPNSAVNGANVVRQPLTTPANAANNMVAPGNPSPSRSVFTPITASTGTAHPVTTPSNTSTPPVASSNRPVSTDASGTTVLRTAPSSTLREATQHNLEAAGAKPVSTAGRTPSTTTPTAGSPSGASPNSGLANSGTIGLPDSLAPAGPKPPQATVAKGTPGPNAANGTTTVTPKSSATTSALEKNPPNTNNGASARPPMPPANRSEEMKSTPLAKPVQTWPRTHVIASGDTLSIISAKYYGTTQQVDRIMKANPSLNPRRLKIGDAVTIPAPDAPMAADGNVAKTNPAEKPSTGATIAAVSDATPSAPTAPGSRTYTVRNGDTLYSIAGKSLGDGKKWKQLFDKNRGVLKNDPKRLKAGMVLTLP